MAQRSKNRCRYVIRYFKKQPEFCNVPLNKDGSCPYHKFNTGHTS